MTASKDSDFYYDLKKEPGNLAVETLHRPGRPRYNINYSKGLVKNVFKRKRQKIVRYFKPGKNVFGNKSINVDNKKTIQNIEMLTVSLSDKGVSWKDNQAECQESLRKETAMFNQELQKNPYNVDIWLKYVDLQEKIWENDKENQSIASLKITRDKQVEIIDKALKSNYNSLKLVVKKVEIWQQNLLNDQYINMLKSQLSLDLPIIIRKYYWMCYLDAIQQSMTHCNVYSTKDVYAACIKDMSKHQKSSYQETHVDLIYRLGSFLRQASLWEQLLTLIKVNLDLNVAGENIKIPAPKDDNSIADEENKILSSGLPTNVVWSRIELLRSKIHWIPICGEADDLQSMVFPVDFVDFVKPISDKKILFTLLFNTIRLLKVPVLTVSQTTLDALLSNDELVTWEYDNIECMLPFLYCLVNEKNFSEKKFTIINNVIQNFSDEPNYLCNFNEYFNFVDSVVQKCIESVEDKEKTAILMWWIRFLQIIVATNVCSNTKSDKINKEISNLKKRAKNILKKYSHFVVLYAEYAIFESHVSGIENGINVIEACLKNLPPDKHLNRVYLTRQYIEMSMRKKCFNSASESVCLNLLRDLANNKFSFKEHSSSVSFENETLNQFSIFTEKLLSELNSEDDIDLVDVMLPCMTSNWICCHGYYLIFCAQIDLLIDFIKEFFNKTSTKGEMNDTDERKTIIRKNHLRENFFIWLLHITQTFDHLSEPINKYFEKGADLCSESLRQFPKNFTIVWKATSVLNQQMSKRWRLSILIKKANSSLTIAFAIVLHNYIELYKKYDPDLADLWQPGSNQRMYNILLTIIERPHLKKCSLLRRIFIDFIACHCNLSNDVVKSNLYQALDDCPWNKALYYTGCIRVPSEFNTLVDIMLEKQLRLHVMPEEVQQE